MDFVYRLFYLVFNAYYQHGKYRDAIPRLTAFSVLVTFVFCMFLLIEGGIWWFGGFPNGGGYLLPQLGACFVGLLSLAVVYLLFYRNRRYLQIYLRYRDDASVNSLRARVLGWTVIIAVLVISFAAAIFMLGAS